MIEISNLIITNDEKEILNISNCCFEDKDTYLLSGANGSGKSTLIKVIANDIDFEKYQNVKVKGQILVDNCDILSSIKAREEFNKKLCYVSQEDIFLTDKIGQELVLYYNIANNKSASKRDIALIIEGLEIDKLLLQVMQKDNLNDVFELKINSLSGGQKKIVHIVREIVKNSKAYYFLLDEPLNNLDTKNITAISNLIRKISNDKLVIIVSHCKIFPFINNEMRIINGNLEKCDYNCLSCFGIANNNGYYDM